MVRELKGYILGFLVNIDGAPISARAHTHPFHSQSSRLLSTSLSLGTTCFTGAYCVRGIVESSHPHAAALRLSLSQHRHLFTFSPIGLAFCAVINNNEVTILHDVAAQNGKLAVHHAGPYSVGETLKTKSRLVTREDESRVWSLLCFDRSASRYRSVAGYRIKPPIVAHPQTLRGSCLSPIFKLCPGVVYRTFP